MLLTACAGGFNHSQLVTQTSEEIIIPLEPEVVPPTPEEIIPEPPVVESALPASDKYTIQILSVSQGVGFEQYTSQLPSDIPFWANNKMVDNKAWSALLYGEFDSKQSAEAAMEKLPAKIKSFGPYIRSFGSIYNSTSPDLVRL